GEGATIFPIKDPQPAVDTAAADWFARTNDCSPSLRSRLAVSTLIREPLHKEDVQPAATEPAAAPARTPKPVRVMSLDAHRGFIMIAMASSGLALAGAAKHFPDSAVMQSLGFHTDHVAWVGCSFWDLIQPSFIFMVGVAIPYSYASRKARGEGEAR